MQRGGVGYCEEEVSMTLPKPGHKWKQKSIYHTPKVSCSVCGYFTRRHSDLLLISIKSPLGNNLYSCAWKESCAERSIEFLDMLDVAYKAASNQNRLVLYGA